MIHKVLSFLVPWVVLFRVYGFLGQLSHKETCKLARPKGAGPFTYSRDGEVVIGGILKICFLHVETEPTYDVPPMFPACAVPSFHYIRHLLVFIFTTEEINNRQILPNLTLGFKIYDSCSSEVITLESTLNFMSETDKMVPNYCCQERPKAIAFIGHLLSSTTFIMAQITQLYKYSQISYGAMDPMFQNRILFPTFYRCVPNEQSQFNVIMQLLLHFGWTWVAIITSDDDSNKQASEELRKHLDKNGICVAFTSVISKTSMVAYERVFTKIYESSVNVFVLYCTTATLLRLLLNYRHNHWHGKVYICSVTLRVITDNHFKIYLHALNGSLLISSRKGEIPGFRSYLSTDTLFNISDNIFLRQLWAIHFGSQLKAPEPNSPHRSPKDIWNELVNQNEVPTHRMTYNIYNAVHLVAQALHRMHLDKVLFESPSKVLASNARYKLNPYLKRARLKAASEDIFFDEDGSVAGGFDVVNWIIDSRHKIHRVNVGGISTSSHQLILNEHAIKWHPYFKQTPRSLCSELCPVGHRRSLPAGKPSCCFDCVPCSDGEIANRTDTMKCLQCPDHQWSNPTRDLCIDRTKDFLAYEDYLGSALASFATSFVVITLAVLWTFVKHRNSPIVKANNRNLSYLLLVSLMLSFLCCFFFIGYPMKMTCLFRQTAFAVIFAAAISSILAKTVTVIIAFNATKPGSKLRKYMGSKVSLCLVGLCLLGQLVICSSWLICSPPFVEFDGSSVPGTIILQCNEGSMMAFHLAVSYIGVLAVFSFIVAFNARKLPDSFNEAQHITFSMLLFCSVWATFIPTYLSTKGKYMVAVEVFTILTSTGGLLACIFLPKCYIIVIKPGLHINIHKTMKQKTSMGY